MMGMIGPGLPFLLPLPIAALTLAVVLVPRFRMAFFGFVTLLLSSTDASGFAACYLARDACIPAPSYQER